MSIEDIYEEAFDNFNPPSPNFSFNRPVVFFDTETTGVDRVNDRIIELSIVKFFPNGNSEINTQRFNPTIPIPEAASIVHGISDDDVKNKPTFAAKANEIFHFFNGCDVAGYNIIDFDLPIIVEEFLRAKSPLPFNQNTKYLDALKIFYMHEKRDLTSAYKFYCGMELGEDAHSAEADTLATVDVLNSQIEKYKLSHSINELHDICNEGNEIIDYERKFKRDEIGSIVFTFGKNKNKRACDNMDYLHWMLSADFSNYTKLIIRKIINGEIE
jgi:DNA polymerase-3 subunit epsilon